MSNVHRLRLTNRIFFVTVTSPEDQTFLRLRISSDPQGHGSIATAAGISALRLCANARSLARADLGLSPVFQVGARKIDSGKAIHLNVHKAGADKRHIVVDAAAQRDLAYSFSSDLDFRESHARNVALDLQFWPSFPLASRSCGAAGRIARSRGFVDYP